MEENKQNIRDGPNPEKDSTGLEQSLRENNAEAFNKDVQEWDNQSSEIEKISSL